MIFFCMTTSVFLTDQIIIYENKISDSNISEITMSTEVLVSVMPTQIYQ